MKNFRLSKSDNYAIQIASVLKIGYFPFASGTVVCVPAAVILYLLRDVISTSQIGSGFTLYLILLGLVVCFGTWAADRCETIFREKDSHKIVIDEVAGMMISMFLIPITFRNLIIAFFIFRFFDVAKPLGINGVQKYKGGFGVMIDDILGGIYTAIAVNLLLWIF